MKISSINKRHIFITAACILVITVIALLYKNNPDTEKTAIPQASTMQNAVSVTKEKQNSSIEESIINIYTCDKETEYIFKKYSELHPEFKYRINYVEDANGTYFIKVLGELEKGDKNAMDIYCIPGWYAREFINGEYSGYACTYKELGIDIDTAVKKADIPQYAIDSGTNRNGDIVTLPYESNVGVFMYRRSIAREVWGTDDPVKIGNIIGGGSESWDMFLKAAQTLKKHGCYIVPECDAIWPLTDTWSNETTDLKGLSGTNWDKFMGISKYLLDNGCIRNDTVPYSEQWLNDLDGKGDKPIFGIVPRSFNVLQSHLLRTAGDWAICLPPVSNVKVTDDAAILVNKSSHNKDKLRLLMEWITLDTSKTGLQNCLVSDTVRSLAKEKKMSVVSGVVLKNTNDNPDFLGGQNMNALLYEAQKTASGKQQGYNGLETPNAGSWLDVTKSYINGDTDKEAAIASFDKREEENREYIRTYFFDPSVNTVFNIYSMDQELDNIVRKYAEKHPEFNYKIHAVEGSLIDDNHFLTQIADSLQKDDGSQIDIYSVPSVYAREFIKGKYSKYASTYKELGIDVNTALKKAGIPQFAIDAGTNRNGEVIALPYETSVCVFAYRRSIARKVWGTDDPDKIADIIGAGTDNWDKFKEAAQTLKKNGYYVVPGYYGVYPAFDEGTDTSGLDLDESSSINPKWEEFMDLSKYLFDNGCMRDTEPYTDQWLKDLGGKGSKPVFGVVAAENDITRGYLKRNLESTSGDWAVCIPPCTALGPGAPSGILVNKNSQLKDKIAPLIEWITLDSSERGLQFSMANDTLYNGGDKENSFSDYDGKRTVISRTIMNNVNNSVKFLRGQNINSVVSDAINIIDRKPQLPNTDLDSLYASSWIEMTKAYLKGDISKEAAIAEFKAGLKKIKSDYLSTH